MSKRIRIDPAKEKIVEAIIGPPQSSLSYPPLKDDSIDTHLEYALEQLRKLLRNIAAGVSQGRTDRDIALGLKDCITLLMDLRQHEKDLLDAKSDEELEKLASE